MLCAGATPAIKHARHFLANSGIPFSDSPNWNTRHLLLDVPSFRPGLWTEENLDTLLASLPNDVLIWGGNLNHPSLASYRTIDLLKDETYLLENAVITADCTISLAGSLLDRSWEGSRVLIIGWGRIGKSLSNKMKDLGCDVTVYSRSHIHRCEARSLGLSAEAITENIDTFHIIINTAPAHVLTVKKDSSTLCIDLASVKGISGDDVIWARGLPGTLAPEQSGKLIADTILRLSREVS